MYKLYNTQKEIASEISKFLLQSCSVTIDVKRFDRKKVIQVL